MGYQVNRDFPHLWRTRVARGWHEHEARAWNVRNRRTRVDIHDYFVRNVESGNIFTVAVLEIVRH